MQLPRPVFSGPLAQRDATVLLAVSTFMITARIPSGFVLLALGPMAVIVIQGLRSRAGWPSRAVKWLLATMLVCSLLSVLAPPKLLLTFNSFMIGVIVALVAVGALFTGRPLRALDRLVDGVYAGLMFHWGISMFEALSGFKLLPLLYPGANTAKAVAGNRLFVTSLFPNYNDYSVAMTILVGFVVARMLFNNAVSPGVKLGRALVVLTAVFEIVYMGSRGALLALVAIGLLMLVQNVRLCHDWRPSIRTLVFGALALVTMAVAALNSPWIADNSTASRGRILNSVVAMMTQRPLDGLLGYGSFGNYKQLAAQAYPGTLMDPHNMLLEMAITYGVPSLVAWLVCWLAGLLVLLQRRHAADWRTLGCLVVLACYPVLGVVPSSTLRYYLVWIITIVALSRAGLYRSAAERLAEPPQR